MAAIDVKDEATLLSHLSVLCELALSAPGAFEEKSEEIITFLKDEILSNSSTVVSFTIDRVVLSLVKRH
jgi:hypothetical protein